ncbi:hypothetical protein C8J57DRAFT_1724365, partial [Mycena rebaudengoi]
VTEKQHLLTHVLQSAPLPFCHRSCRSYTSGGPSGLHSNSGREIHHEYCAVHSRPYHHDHFYSQPLYPDR